MTGLSRRTFLKSSAAGLTLSPEALWAFQQRSQPIPGERPAQVAGVTVLNPRARVPMSLIIDDSTCLVNLAHFGIPQFAQTFPDKYKQDWRKLPREIPDSFVRKFGEWCAENDVKGKYSIVPYPACVGWVDRYIPGWSHRELAESLDLVREVILPHWDIHPEMISHTRVIDTKTGRPYADHSEKFMENWRWTDGKSVDQLTDYLAYALRILKNAGLPCEGITTPGGFGNRVLAELSQATLQSCRDVYRAEIPHYFRHLYTGKESVVPRVEYASGLETDDPRCSVSIIGCTGDWTGGWDAVKKGDVDRFITEDLQGGRLPEVIERGEPACLVCHWPGIYFNGEESGFQIFQEVVRRVHARYDHLRWMKLSEIARYWAAKELTAIEQSGNTITLRAPFATADYTVEIASREKRPPRLSAGGKQVALQEVRGRLQLTGNTWAHAAGKTVVCFELVKGRSELRV